MQDVLVQNTELVLGEDISNLLSELEVETCTLVCQYILQFFLGWSYLTAKKCFSIWVIHYLSKLSKLSTSS